MNESLQRWTPLTLRNQPMKCVSSWSRARIIDSSITRAWIPLPCVEPYGRRSSAVVDREDQQLQCNSCAQLPGAISGPANANCSKWPSALRLTGYLGRERLPSLYLWVAYYGWRMDSFNQACSRVGIDPLLASELDAAMLVARLKYPEQRTFHREQLRRMHRRAAHLMSLGNSKERYQSWSHFVFRPH